jgi:hypothetical protein
MLNHPALDHFDHLPTINVRIPAIAITCSDASRSGIPIDREQCGAGA